MLHVWLYRTFWALAVSDSAYSLLEGWTWLVFRSGGIMAQDPEINGGGGVPSSLPSRGKPVHIGQLDGQWTGKVASIDETKTGQNICWASTFWATKCVFLNYHVSIRFLKSHLKMFDWEVQVCQPPLFVIFAMVQQSRTCMNLQIEVVSPHSGDFYRSKEKEPCPLRSMWSMLPRNSHVDIIFFWEHDNAAGCPDQWCPTSGFPKLCQFFEHFFSSENSPTNSCLGFTLTLDLGVILDMRYG